MKLNRNIIILISITTLVVLGYAALSTYLYFSPLSSITTKNQEVKEIQTEIDSTVITELKDAID